MNDGAAVAWLRQVATADKELAEAAPAPYLDEAARCDAVLALLELHAPVMFDGGGVLTCAVCVTFEDDDHEYGEALPVSWPCMTLEIAAAGYRHRDGYAGHWDARTCPACGKPEAVLPLGHELATPMDGGAPSCEIRPAPGPGIVRQFLADWPS